MTLLMRAPTETESFLLVAEKFDLRIWCPRRHTCMFSLVPYHDPTIYTHSGNHVGILRHVTSFVDFARVIDLLDDIEFHRWRLLSARGRASIATDFASLLVVVACIWSGRIRQLDMGDLKVIAGFL